ncbi:MAG TPA: prolipoprotein diacylglyceryl transferase family protein [Gemmatimonadaceae bacterium]|nr:prolipoprotein diacylglyceryl transferase family protein [Gemmatimonadaceae bacterium]
MLDAAVSIVHHAAAVRVGPFTLTGFGVAMLGAFLIGQAVAQSALAQRGEDASVMGDVLIAAVVGGLAGGKIYYAILTRDPSALIARSGFVFWGGLAGGILASFAWIHRKGLSFAKISDASAPGLAAAYAVGRTGCWAVGDDYGRAWANRFAVRFPEGSPPSTVQNLVSQFHQSGFAGQAPTDVVSVYPTQLFEVAMGLVMFAILWRLRGHRHAAGWLFGVYCVLAGVERICVEVFRAKDDRFFGPFTMAQVIGVVFVVAGIAWMMARRTPRPAAPAAA